MNVEILSSSDRAIPPDAVRGLYDTVPWWPDRTDAEIAAVLGDGLAVGAWNDEELIGFARAISDDHFHAYIDDVVVHPAHQRQGIGADLVARLVAGLRGVNEVTLFCDVDRVPFYERLGFKLRESQRVLHLRAG